MYLSYNFHAAPFVGEIRKRQEEYKGPLPDNVLTIELRNRGRVPALKVSGRFDFYPPIFEPVSYPGYTNIRVVWAPAVPIFEVRVPPSDLHRAPPEPTPEQLTFEIPIRFQNRDWEESSKEGFTKWQMMINEEVKVHYRFVPELGKSTEGMWIVRMSAPTAPPSPVNHGPVADERSRWSRFLDKFTAVARQRY
jgi:hypothetical protein